MATPQPARTEAHVAVRNLTLLSASLGTVVLLGFVVRAILRRQLDPGAFGPFDAAESFTFAWGIVLGLGVDAYVRTTISVEPSRASAFVGSTLWLRLVLMVPLALGMWGVMRLTHRDAAFMELVWVLSGVQLLLAVNATFAALLQANTTVGGLPAVNLGARVLWGAGAMLGVEAGLGVAAIGWAWLGSELLKAVASGWLCRRHLGLRFGWPALGSTVAIVGATLPYFLHTLFRTVGSKADVFILSVVAEGVLGEAAGRQETAWYGAAATLGGLATMLTPLLAGVLAPMLARTRTQDAAAYEGLVRRTLELALIASIPMTLLIGVGADTWVRVMFGEEYGPAVPAVRLLAPVYLLNYASLVAVMVLQVEGKLRQLAWLAGGAMAAVLVLDVVAAQVAMNAHGAGAGGTACAAVQLGGELALAVAMFWLLGRRAIDRRTTSMLLKTALVAALVVGVDLGLRAVGLDAALGFARLGLDSVLYLAVIFGARVVVWKEVQGFLREAF
ncbi:MAG: oligosaccharide flippase family protein [Myxococcaceae bacterium]|nr:oligosaccharide flippase family protein [Myxococcaceae bacterium]